MRKTNTLKVQREDISTNAMLPGDLVFFNTYKKGGHFGIFKFIGASTIGIAVADMSKGYWKDKLNVRAKRF